MGEKKRVTFYLDATERRELDRIKQTEFYDRSYSEMYRHLIRLGLEKAAERRL